MDWCKETGRIGLIMPIISRKSADTAISMLNNRLKRTFKHFMLPDLPPMSLANDNVHLTAGGYDTLGKFVETFAQGFLKKESECSTMKHFLLHLSSFWRYQN